MNKILIILIVFVMAMSTVLATESWDLTGTYTIVFTCTSGCSGDYPHTMEVNVMDLGTGDFSGTGYYNPNNAYTWDVTGTVSGSSVSPFHILYTGLNAGYYVDLTGTINGDGSMSGTATSSSSQTFDWVTTSGAATFVRTAEITSPGDGETVSGLVSFNAILVDKDGNDNVQWAVRKGTCAAGTNTVFGNVDGFNDHYTWNGADFHAETDVSGWVPGMYCFIFNPTESAGDTPLRETREFVVFDKIVYGGGHMLETDAEGKRKDWLDISFGGFIGDAGALGLFGEWQINFHNVNVNSFDNSRFHTTEITSLNLFDGNTESCEEAMNFGATGEWNGIPGYKIVFRAGDSSDPSSYDTDTVRVTLRNPGGGVVYDTHTAGEFTDESDCVGTARTGLDTGNIVIQA